MGFRLNTVAQHYDRICMETNKRTKQPCKQTKNQPNKQPNKQTTEQSDEQMMNSVMGKLNNTHLSILYSTRNDLREYHDQLGVSREHGY